MSKLRRIIYLLVFLAVLFVLRTAVASVFPTLPEAATTFWFTSGLLLIVLGVLVTEKYFTRPLDVVVNCVTLVIVLQTIDVSHRFPLVSTAYAYAALMGGLALVGFALGAEEADPTTFRQRLASALYRVTAFFGSARVLFSAMFLFSLFEYFLANIETAQLVSHQELLVLAMIVFWTAALLVEPFDRRVVSPIIEYWQLPKRQALGHVVRRHEPQILMVQKLSSIGTPSFGDLALIHGASQKASDGVVAMYLDDADTDEGRLLRFYALDGQSVGAMPGTIASGITSAQGMELLSGNADGTASYDQRLGIVGTVTSESDIDVIRIRMLEGVDARLKLAEDLLSTDVYGRRVKYQVIGVTTGIETVTGQNRAGTKIISAQQIGEWDFERRKFVGASWVPDINALVFQEAPAAITQPPLPQHCFSVGVVPKSTFPVYLNFDDTITHHLAIIGKTGTGKSQMAARIVAGLVADGYKVVVLEVDRTHAQSLSKRIPSTIVAATKTTWTSKVEKRRKGGRDVEETVWDCALDLTVQDGRGVFVIDFDDHAKNIDGGPVSHAESAAAVIKQVLIHKAKPQNSADKICIVLEEAYDFIPESTFGAQDFGQPHVSRAAQLVLKCRKHQVGFLVITQRTALVSKTILYQCNTIIALQTFDETSKNFMSAYINSKYLESMSILPRFRAIVVGKGSSCDKPIIVDFEERNATLGSLQVTPGILGTSGTTPGPTPPVAVSEIASTVSAPPASDSDPRIPPPPVSA